MKTCSACRVTKMLSEFYAHGGFADGYQSQCRACQCAKAVERSRKRSETPATPPDEKACPRCRETKPRTEFAVSRRSVDGLRDRCKLCAARQKRLERYGVDDEWYAARWKEQDGRCMICEGDLALLGDHVDHCHTTLAPRGLLCGSCNRGLGLFRDDPIRLESAIRYLQQDW